MEKKSRIEAEIKAVEKQLADLERKRVVLKETIQKLKDINRSLSGKQTGIPQSFPEKVANESSHYSGVGKMFSPGGLKEQNQ